MAPEQVGEHLHNHANHAVLSASEEAPEVLRSLRVLQICPFFLRHRIQLQNNQGRRLENIEQVMKGEIKNVVQRTSKKNFQIKIHFVAWGGPHSQMIATTYNHLQHNTESKLGLQKIKKSVR